MITENEVTDILIEEFPEINFELEKLSNSANLYKAMQCFADFTKRLIKKRNVKEVKHCLNVAEMMLKEGSNPVKNVIENVYVFIIGTAIELSASSADHLKEICNGSLKKEYLRQINASGI